MLIGNIWILVKSWFAPAKPSFPSTPIAAAADLGVGEVKLFSYPTPADPCIMIRTANTFVAYSQKCTHLSCAVYFAKDKNRLECPCHEGYFSVTDGSVLQGPPTRPLPRIILKHDGDTLIATGMEL
jgi:Rieske Fe-S protein